MTVAVQGRSNRGDRFGVDILLLLKEVIDRRRQVDARASAGEQELGQRSQVYDIQELLRPRRSVDLPQPDGAQAPGELQRAPRRQTRGPAPVSEGPRRNANDTAEGGKGLGVAWRRHEADDGNRPSRQIVGLQRHKWHSVLAVASSP